MATGEIAKEGSPFSKVAAVEIAQDGSPHSTVATGEIADAPNKGVGLEIQAQESTLESDLQFTRPSHMLIGVGVQQGLQDKAVVGDYQGMNFASLEDKGVWELIRKNNSLQEIPKYYIKPENRGSNWPT